ncbi:PilW family protein [Spartinivicinus poritis]|uniref:PilW family protein n=1 Tax=Spartinivicinus poritis TaxID=2994640 RepID=A0ABT5UCI8_9GAMM|nr:PilW family protein [Spartinivicinus sp. A2-2]MDE1464089.1 PilW family protein [Spartinivicinus sp. A2-2]
MRYTFTKQQGFTLIELMIALTLGLFLSGAALMMYVANKNTYGTIVDNSHLQENARYAQKFIQESIMRAGWRVITASGEIETFTPGTAADLKDPGWKVDQFITAINNHKGGSGEEPIEDSDILFTRYYGSSTDQTMQDCSGTAHANSQVVTEILFVNKKFELKCRIVVDNAIEKTITLISGVENLQLLFGADTDKSQDYIANSYMNAADVTSKKLWEKIVSVRIGLLVTSGIFSSNANNKDKEGKKNKYTIFDQANIAISDSKLYGQVFNSTVSVRNPLR